MTAAGVSLLAALMNFASVLEFASKLINLILPVIVGAIIALFIVVPMNGIEKRLSRLFSRVRRKPSKKALSAASFVITLICVALVLTLVLVLLIPEVSSSVKVLYTQIESRIKELSRQHFDIAWLEELYSKINFNEIMSNFSDIANKLSIGADFIFANLISVFSSTVSIVTTTLFAIIIAGYAALEKESLKRDGKKVICAYLPAKWSRRILKFCRSFSRIFSKFLFGQCSEALILGTLMFFAFSIFRIPYAILVSVLTAVCAIIPYVGAFISCGISVFLTLLIAPELALRCLIVYLAVQFIETQIIYPRVVGTAVGLSPLYTLVAALIGGNLFGIIGIIFFIPLFAVIYELAKEDMAERLAQRAAAGQIPPEELGCNDEEAVEPRQRRVARVKTRVERRPKAEKTKSMEVKPRKKPAEKKKKGS